MTLLENVRRIVNALDAIRSAIIDKGQTPGTKCDTYADAIRAIETGTDVSDTTATKGDVMQGTYFYNSKGVKEEGQIRRRTITHNTVRPDDVKAYAGGYYGEFEFVGSAEGTTAQRSDVASGKFFFEAEGNLVEGSMPDHSNDESTNIIIETRAQAQSNPKIARGFHSGLGEVRVLTNGYTVPASTIKSGITGGQTFTLDNLVTSLKFIREPNFISANIVSGVSILGLTGTASRSKFGSFTASATSSATITLGFKPKYLLCVNNNTYSLNCGYWNGTSWYYTSGNSRAFSDYVSITDTGFTFKAYSSNYAKTTYYLAIE